MNAIWRLPEGVLARLEEESRTRGVTKSELVRESLEKSVGPTRKVTDVSCYDLLSNLVGSLKGLPRDLAVNPKYMDDLGN